VTRIGSQLAVRVITVTRLETHREIGRDLDSPAVRAAAAAVVSNPFAGRYVADLTELAEAGEELSALLAPQAVAAMDGRQPQSYGKGAVVGCAGEIEHAAAILHPKFGAPLRAAVGGGTALIPSAKKRGPAGTAIDIPLHCKDAAFVRSHFDAMEVRVADAPHDDEILVVVAVAAGGRPLARVGGLRLEDARGEDGLR
jgi:hypothetical protein